MSMKNRRCQSALLQRTRATDYAGLLVRSSEPSSRNGSKITSAITSPPWGEGRERVQVCRNATSGIAVRRVRRGAPQRRRHARGLPNELAPHSPPHEVPRVLTIGRCHWIALVLSLAVLLVPAVAGAQEASPRIASMKIGLGGIFKVGYWTPIRVTLAGGSAGFRGKLEFTAPDSDDLTTRFVDGDTELIEIPPQGAWTGWRYVKLGRIDGTIRGLLREEDGAIVDERPVGDIDPQPATYHWVVTLGNDVKVEESAALFARMRDEKLISSLIREPDELPDQWYGYEGVNVVVVASGTASPLELINDRQYAALLHWLRLGGRLVLTAGHRAAELFDKSHRLYDLRPGEFVEADPFWKASGLENFARAADRVRPDEMSPLAVYSELRGRVLCYEGAGGTDDRALITRFPVGFGEVTYVALDVDLPPISTWPSRARLLAKLLQTRSDEEDSAISDEGMGQVTHVGYDDISGQLRAALDQFPGVTMVHFAWVAGLLVLYILVLGPIDFFGLRKLQRFHWTWVTFPLIVVLFCGLAVWLSGRWKGAERQLNQVDVVDIDPAGQWARGTTWSNIYNPRAAMLGVTFTPAPAVLGEFRSPQSILSWQGLTGTALGGMNTTATVDVLSGEYQIYYPSADDRSQQVGIEGLPIHTASTKGLLARWEGKCSVGDVGQLTASREELLQGTVTNPLNVELSNAWVYFENWAYPIENRLGPGDTVRLGEKPPLDLSWQLARRRMVGARRRIAVEPR